MEQVEARKRAQDLERKNVLLPNQRGYRVGKTFAKTQPVLHALSLTDSWGRNKLAVAVDLEDACKRVQFKLLLEFLVQYGINLTFTRWLGQHSRRENLPCDLKIGSPCPNNWQWDFHNPPPPLPSPVPSPLQYLQNGTGDLKSNGLSQVLTLADDGLTYKTASDTYTEVTAVQEQLEKKSVTMVLGDRVRNQSKHSASTVMHPHQQSNRTINASSLLQWRSHITQEQSQIPAVPLWHNADLPDAGRTS